MTDIANHPSAAFCLTPSDLKALGRDEFAYVRKYRVNGKLAFVLHAADGTAIAVQDDVNSARLSARHQDLEIVSVH